MEFVSGLTINHEHISPFSLIQAVFAILVVFSLALAVLLIRKWSKLEIIEPVIGDNSGLMQMTIVLPTWNEEKVIESKLNNIYSQNYPKHLVEVIVIDSASTDSTVDIVNRWLAEMGLVGDSRFRIIEEGERRGKSVSINRAFSEAHPQSEILMMSDIDCRLGENSLIRLASWFNDDSIGAVTGRQVLINSGISRKASEEESYRDFYSRMRISETKLHSTPIFHGECSAYRRKALEGHKLVENANADDSQMAVSVVRSGYRSVYDPGTIFFEMAPPDATSSRIQKVRRAQGLVRHFWRNKGMIFDGKYGNFRKIMALELNLHILVPIFVLLGFISGFAHIFESINSLGSDPATFLDFPLIEKIMLSADILVLILLFSGLAGIPVPGGRTSL